MFALFGRKRSETCTPPDHLIALDDGEQPTTDDPAAQVELVEEALEKLDAVRLLVGRLPEIPLGDRQSLIAQLASTADSLRSLTFLDAIY